MLTHKNLSFIYIVLLLLFITLDLAHFEVSLWAYILLIASYLCIVAWGSSFICSNFHTEVTCGIETYKKELAITFDDGPAGETTDRILDILKANNIEAAFFCIGRNMEANPAQAKRIADEGHVIGNHSYSHDFFIDLYRGKKLARELTLTDQVVKNITGRLPKMFRPPYGVTTPALAKALKKGDYTVIGWNVRSMDTVTKNERELLKKVTRHIDAGNIVLFHDSMPVTANALQSYIDEVREKGYKIVRLDKMLNTEAYA